MAPVVEMAHKEDTVVEALVVVVVAEGCYLELLRGEQQVEATLEAAREKVEDEGGEVTRAMVEWETAIHAVPLVGDMELAAKVATRDCQELVARGAVIVERVAPAAVVAMRKRKLRPRPNISIDCAGQPCER